MTSEKNPLICYIDFTVKSKHDTLLSIEELMVHEGESALIYAPAPEGKSLLLKTLYNYPGEQTKREVNCPRKITQSHKNKQMILLLEFQPTIFNNLSVLKNITLPLKHVSLRAKNKIMEYLGVFGLEFRSNVPAGDLSLSEQKAIELIRAVFLLPDIILIDDYDLVLDLLPEAKIRPLLNDVLWNGGGVLSTARRKLESFDRYFSISNKRLKIA